MFYLSLFCSITFGLESSYATGDIYVLLAWSCALYTNCQATTLKFTTTSSFDALLGAIAILLDFLLGATKAKASLQRSALKKANGALVSVCLFYVLCDGGEPDE
jgi:hypothetical protein